MGKDEAKQEVARLVSKLDSLTEREVKKYDEANTKKDFIEPLFSALGWATKDRREVTAEDKVSRRRVDYAFRIEGIPKFFLEAKPLKADLDNPEYARQAINYAWTKGVTWAVLTDFEGLKVFNAEWEERDLRRNIVKDIRYKEYVDRFDELWLLSKEAMKKGLLDREAEKWGKISKKSPVGEQLFEDLIKWRWELRRHLEPYNRDYSKAEIDEAVQRILDRLIFIRTAEDREIEPQRLLLSLVREWEGAGGKDDLIRRLNKLFRDFDEGYDSRLFETHFCEKLDCEPLPFVKTIRGLYQTPDAITEYDFNAIDADVLGGIYEQYLGYAQGLAEEEAAAKKMRRKKRGIYYTPKFVVRYIVENTVGRLLQERSHDQILKLRILDPACGSGSFLIEAFEALNEYHQSVASGSSPTRAGDDDFFDFARRLQILSENIYGADLDPQAVEIAQLNLLLKTLHRRELLPNLDPNIRCGNSLISGMPIELGQYFGANWEAKRPFNWEEEFPKIMKEGGFDIVIGNPPYVRFLELPEDERNYYRAHYKSAYKQYDIYVLFIERGINLLKPGGRLGFITSSKFFATDYGYALREYILDNCCVEIVADLSILSVFKDAAIYPYVFILRKEPDEQTRIDNAVHIISNLESEEQFTQQDFPVESLPQSEWRTRPELTFDIVPGVLGLLKKIESDTEQLAGICTITRGFRPPPPNLLVSPLEFSALASRQQKRLAKFVRGKGSVGRYTLNWDGAYLRYQPETIAESKPQAIFQNPKIMIVDYAVRPEAYFDDQGFYCLKTIYLILAKHESQYDLRYVLSILNSRIMDFYFRSRFFAMHMRGGYMRFRKQFLKLLPIRRIDFDNPQDVKMHDDLVALVERMLDLHKRLKDAKGEEKKNLERQIARTDRKIDELVYELYGITAEERKIIEGKT